MSSPARSAVLPLAGHGRLIAFLLLGFFGVGAPRLFTNAAAFALFLDTFDAHLLPYTYFLAGIAIPLVSAAYLRLADRVPLQTLLLVVLLTNVVVLLVLWLGLTGEAEPWLVMTATVWVEVEWVIGNMVYWGLAERVFDVRQAKRHFGIIAAGEPAAAIVFGLMLPALLLVMSVADLLLLTVGALVVAMLLVRFIARAHADHLAVQDANVDGGAEWLWRSTAEPRTRSYLGFVVLLAFVIHIVFFVVDNAFYSLVEQRFEQREQMARFIGLFFAAVGAITLLVNLLATAPFLRHHGLRGGLALVPLMVLVGCIAVLGAEFALGAFAFVFWLGCATKLAHETGWQGIGWPSFLLLYQPLPGAHRTRAMAFLEGVLEPVASAVAAATLLFVTQVLGWRALDLFGLACVLMLAWLALVHPVSRRYYRMLAMGLKDRTLTGVDLLLDDDASQAVLRDGIDSGDPNTRLYCVSLLMRRGDALPDATAEQLLSDREPLVRRETLRALERAPRPGLRDALAKRLDIERYPPTRASLLRAFAASGHPDALKVLRDEMDAEEKAVQLGAMVGLLKFGGVDGVLAAGERFLALVRSAWAADRRLAARVLARTDVRAFDTHLAELLADDNEEVQRDALRAVAQARVAPLLPKVAPLLAEPHLRGTALLAFRSAGVDAVPVLRDAIAVATREAMRTEMLLLLAELDGHAVLEIVDQRPHAVSSSALHKLLNRLSQRGHVASADEQRILTQLMETMLARHEARVEAREAMSALAHVSVVRGALDEAIANDRDCALAVAGMVLDLPKLRQPWQDLTEDGEDGQARAVELIEELAPTALARPITLMLDGSHAPSRAATADTKTRAQAMQALSSLASNTCEAGTPWIQAAALYTLGREPADVDPEVVTGALDSPHEVVRETALWALHRIDPRAAVEPVMRALRDRSDRVARIAETLQITLRLSR